MQDYKFSQAEEGFSSKLALFDPPRQETAILEHERIRYYPKDAISPEAPIVFRIDPNSGGYLDGSNTTMTMELKIIGEDNEPITATDKVALTNLPLSTVFSHVQAELNGVEVNQDVGNLYPYKQYMEMLLMDSRDKKLSSSQQKGYFPDRTGTVGVTDPASVTNSNTGLLTRFLLTKVGSSMTIKGNLGLDFLEGCGKYLLNGVSLHLVFYQSKNSFRLLAYSDAKAYKVVIESMYVRACHVKMRPELLISHSQLLAEDKLAMYAYPRTCMRSFIIPRAVNQFDVSQVLSDRIPALVVVGLVHSEAFAGKYTKKPFEFRHYNLNHISFQVGGHSVPDRPFTPDFTKSDYAEAYAAFQAMNCGRGNGIAMNDFAKGNTLFCFNTQHHVDLREGVYPIIRKGNTRLEMRFKSNLEHSLNCIVYMVTPGLFHISNARRVTVEY